jgi:PPE-repeat protein
MILDFSWLPPEINSARISNGAGSGPLFVAASAWDALASDLSAAASSFNSVVTGLTDGPWTGPSSAAMAAAAAPYVGWLSSAAGHAAAAAGQARVAATAFESALAATVPLAAVTANRAELMALIATNILGQNSPAIAMTEFEYLEMWAQDVAAMLAYHGGALSVAAALPSFSLPPVDLVALAGLVTAPLAGTASQVAGLLSSAVPSLAAPLAPLTDVAGSAVSQASALVSGAPIASLSTLAQVAMMPVSIMMSPIMMAAQAGMGANSAALAGATGAAGAVDPAKFVSDAAPAMKGLGGGAGLGGAAAELGKSRLVGAMSVPPTWQGSTPARMVSAAMSGLGGELPAAAAAAGAPMGGGMPFMPMPMGGMGAGAGMPGGMMGRGGASPHVVQSRPSVVPRVGVG